jgi:hypothetical protein
MLELRRKNMRFFCQAKWLCLTVLLLGSLSPLPAQASHFEIVTTASTDPAPKPQSRFTKFEELPMITLGVKDRSPQLIIECRNKFAIITFNGQKGPTDFTLESVPAGAYLLEIELETYQPISEMIQIKQGMRYRLESELVQITGTAVLDRDNPDQQWFIDQEPTADTAILPVGNHQVVLRQFGYLDAAGTISVQADRTVHLKPHLVESPFAVRLLPPERQRFSPLNAGLAGTVRLGFTASGPATTTLSIINQTKKIVFQKIWPTTNQPDNWLYWDGRDQQDATLPEGQYTWMVTAQKDGGTNLELINPEPITISYSDYRKSRSSFSGVSGLLLVADSYTLPPLSLQTSFDAWLGLPQFSQTTGFSSLLGQVSFRLGLVPQLEVTLAGLWGFDLNGTQGSLTSLVAGLKWAFAPPTETAPFSAALTLRGAGTFGLQAGQPLPDPNTTLSAYQIGIPVQWAMGPPTSRIAWHLEPSLALGPWLPVEGTMDNATLHGFALVRGGVSFDSQNLFFGLSAEIRSGDFIQTWAIGYPVKLAAECRLTLPQSNFLLGVAAGADLFPNAVQGWVGINVGILM